MSPSDSDRLAFVLSFDIFGVRSESRSVAIEITDARGVTLRFDGPPRRVVSLVPSITETLFDLGVGDSVVGITDWCIFPAWLREATLGRTPRRVGGTKNPRIDEIRALKPDLVHLNLEENLKKQGDELEAFVPVFVTEPKSPADVTALLDDLGLIHACQASAAEQRSRLERLLALPPLGVFTFACPIWKKPWMWCGGDTYVSALVESVGGRNVLGSHERYPSLALEDVVSQRPDVIFLPDEPFEFGDGDATELRDTFRGRIIGPFPGHLFTWHGTRTVKGLHALREWLA